MNYFQTHCKQQRPVAPRTLTTNEKHQLAADSSESPTVFSPSAKYLNQSFVALAILSTVHNGASFHWSIDVSMVATPSSKRTLGVHCSRRLIFEISAKVQSGSPGRFGM